MQAQACFAVTLVSIGGDSLAQALRPAAGSGCRGNSSQHHDAAGLCEDSAAVRERAAHPQGAEADAAGQGAIWPLHRHGDHLSTLQLASLCEKPGTQLLRLSRA